MEQYPSDIMSMQELKEYLALKKKILTDTFVVLDLDNNSEHKRLNELTPKYMELQRYILDKSFR